MIYYEIVTFAVAVAITLSTAIVFDKMKTNIIGWLPAGHKLEQQVAYFLYCAQCIGFWVGLGFSIIYMATFPISKLIMLPFLVSALSSIITKFISKD